MVCSTFDYDENIKCYFLGIFHRIGIVLVLKNLAWSEFLFFMTHFLNNRKLLILEILNLKNIKKKSYFCIIFDAIPLVKNYRLFFFCFFDSPVFFLAKLFSQIAFFFVTSYNFYKNIFDFPLICIFYFSLFSKSDMPESFYVVQFV